MYTIKVDVFVNAEDAGECEIVSLYISTQTSGNLSLLSRHIYSKLLLMIQFNCNHCCFMYLCYVVKR